MRLLALSDIHGNIEALDACLSAAGSFDCVLHLGDCVGYGAAPNAVIDRLRSLPCEHVRGNHDRVIAGGPGASGFNSAAAAAVAWTQEHLRADNMDWLAALPQGPLAFADHAGGALLCHGSPDDEDGYILNARAARRALASSPARVIFFGHTHGRAGYALGDPQMIEITITRGRRGRLARHRIGLGPGMRYLVNPGSAGQPRDGDPRAGCLLYDTDKPGQIEWLRVPYDAEAARERILDAGLPHALGDRLLIGR